MSDDPETARQIAELARDSRPLLVLDVDDVLLEFVRPFARYVDSRGHDLRLDTASLFGNIRDQATGEQAEKHVVAEFIAAFFDQQAEWQTLYEGAADSVAAIAEHAEVVLLTAMPHRFRDRRRAHLDALGLAYPLVTTEAPKGPALKALRGETGRPVAFVDDMPHNHRSVLDAVPDASTFHLMSAPELRALLPAPPDETLWVDDWPDATPRIMAALGLRKFA